MQVEESGFKQREHALHHYTTFQKTLFYISDIIVKKKIFILS